MLVDTVRSDVHNCLWQNDEEWRPSITTWRRSLMCVVVSGGRTKFATWLHAHRPGPISRR